MSKQRHIQSIGTANFWILRVLGKCLKPYVSSKFLFHGIGYFETTGFRELDQAFFDISNPWKHVVSSIRYRVFTVFIRYFNMCASGVQKFCPSALQGQLEATLKPPLAKITGPNSLKKAPPFS